MSPISPPQLVRGDSFTNISPHLHKNKRNHFILKNTTDPENMYLNTIDNKEMESLPQTLTFFSTIFVTQCGKPYLFQIPVRVRKLWTRARGFKGYANISEDFDFRSQFYSLITICYRYFLSIFWSAYKFWMKKSRTIKP